MNTLVALIVVVIFATLASAWAGAVRSATLRKKFESLGVIPGRTMTEIIRHVGEPHRRHKISAGREILEWRRVNFHVALGFTAEVCDSVDYSNG
ncbi:MAG: hypothetical protein ACAH21_16425 [Ramlibacter sp.]|nr:hypothetical protein [Ramlibacter sp.]